MGATTGIAEKTTGPCSTEAPCAYAREGSVCTFCWVLGLNRPPAPLGKEQGVATWTTRRR